MNLRNHFKLHWEKYATGGLLLGTACAISAVYFVFRKFEDHRIKYDQLVVQAEKVADQKAPYGNRDGHFDWGEYAGMMKDLNKSLSLLHPDCRLEKDDLEKYVNKYNQEIKSFIYP